MKRIADRSLLARKKDLLLPLFIAGLSGQIKVSFIEATKRGDLEASAELLTSGVNVDMRDNLHRTPLMSAAIRGDVDTVKFLLSRGAFVEATDEAGKTASMLAAISGNRKMVDLLDTSAELNRRLRAAIAFGQVAHVRLELGKGASVNARDSDGDSALIFATKQRMDEIAKILLREGAEVNDRGDDGRTALLWAATLNRIEILSDLIQRHASINLVADNDRSALMLASMYHHTEAVRILCTNGGLVDLPDSRGFTALMLAAQKGYDDVVRLLLSFEANANRSNENGSTALILAERAGHTETARLLNQASGAANNGGQSSEMLLPARKNLEELNKTLIQAVRFGQDEDVQELLKQGASPDAKGSTEEKYMPAIAMAAILDETGILRSLISRGANVNAQDIQGWTALMFAAMSGRTEACRILLAKGADPNVVGSDGTALFLATTADHPEIVHLLSR